MENVIKTIGPFHLTRKDLIAFHRSYRFKKDQFISYARRIIIGGIIFGILNGFIVHSFWSGLIVAVCWTAFFGLFLFLFLPYLSTQIPDLKKILENEIIIKFNEIKIGVYQNDNLSEFSWKNIDCIRQSKTNIFVYVNARTALIIPKNIFSNEAEMSEFIETANQLMENAKATT